MTFFGSLFETRGTKSGPCAGRVLTHRDGRTTSRGSRMDEMKKAFGIAGLVLSVMAGMAPNLTAGPFRRAKATCGPSGCEIVAQNANLEKSVPGDTSTAQGVALLIVSTGRFQHFGGNRGFEGIGMGSTPEAAEQNCCYRSRWLPRERGFARMANGLWVCVCRY